jgi:hypothetical protein
MEKNGYRYPWISHKIPSTWRSMRIRRCRNRSERGFHGLRGGHPEGRWLRSAFHWNCRITWPKGATSPSSSEDASKRPNMGSVVLRWMDALLVIPVTYHCHTLPALGVFTCIYHLPYLGGRLYNTIYIYVHIQDTRIPTVPVAYIGVPAWETTPPRSDWSFSGHGRP